jgi:hypothetical protein
LFLFFLFGRLERLILLVLFFLFGLGLHVIFTFFCLALLSFTLAAALNIAPFLHFGSDIEASVDEIVVVGYTVHDV